MKTTNRAETAYRLIIGAGALIVIAIFLPPVITIMTTPGVLRADVNHMLRLCAFPLLAALAALVRAIR